MVAPFAVAGLALWLVDGQHCGADRHGSPGGLLFPHDSLGRSAGQFAGHPFGVCHFGFGVGFLPDSRIPGSDGHAPRLVHSLPDWGCGMDVRVALQPYQGIPALGGGDGLLCAVVGTAGLFDTSSAARALRHCWLSGVMGRDCWVARIRAPPPASSDGV